MNPGLVHKKGRVAVAMSGGVDSSAVAALLLDEGYELLGLTMAHTDAALEDAVQAESVCVKLGIPHETIPLRDVFEQEVVSPFAQAYADGRTPSPCVVCNRRIKFGVLMDEARKRGCEWMATGHYARLERDGGRVRLLRGLDASKDQSYFLHRLDQAQLRQLLMPLGSWTKEQARALVQERALFTVHRAESQDLCFVGEGGAASVVTARHPDLPGEGPIVNEAGHEVGRHAGYYRYTIGQRDGLNVAAGQRMYVRAVRPEKNEVEIGPRESVLAGGCLVREVNWLAGETPGEGPWVTQLRYRHAGVPSRLLPGDDSGEWRATFDSPQWAVTPGQAAVWYDGDEVLGGGWIEQAWDVA